MEQTIVVPDIGDIKDVEVIEILVQPDETIEVEQSLITLESDKASMEVPAPHSGTVTKLLVQLGDRVSEGAQILTMRVTDTDAAEPAEPPVTESSANQESASTTTKPDSPAQAVAVEPEDDRHQTPPPVPSPASEQGQYAHAGPSVRRFARELGADLTQIRGSGRKGRILREDVKDFVKASLQKPAGSAVQFAGLPQPAEIDFSQFGPIESRPLSRIQKLSAAHLHRSWVTAPHVTQHEEADITELEDFRKQLKAELEPQNIRLTLLPFLMKAAVAGLKRFPDFNASLDASGDGLILKQYYHIGVAVDTADGLVVPVVRDVDKKGLAELAQELGELSVRARDKKLKPNDLQGGSFTISSLGGIGGTFFTPIINQPEVAILGVSRSQTRPVYRAAEVIPRLILPLSLSYDHRVIDGAAAARFIVFVGAVLSDLRRLLV